jgi:hypothetical protein
MGFVLAIILEFCSLGGSVQAVPLVGSVRTDGEGGKQCWVDTGNGTQGMFDCSVSGVSCGDVGSSCTVAFRDGRRASGTVRAKSGLQK